MMIQKVAKQRGYSYPSAIIAQARCESAHGKSQLSAKYNNYFGMKCGKGWKGSSVCMGTKEEYTPGTLTSIAANFRAYNSLEDGINGYFDFIESYKRYANLKTATSPEDYIQKLKADGWATSSKYVSTLTTILNKYNLKVYDGTEPQAIQEVDYDITDGERAVAQDAIRGRYGNGVQRKENLYKAVQRAINAALSRS